MTVSKILLENYIRFLIFKIYRNQKIYNNIIGTTLLYCDILPFLHKKGSEFLIEIGTGDFSIPALAIKASFLRNNIKYIGIDQRYNKLLNLESFMNKLGIEYDIVEETFNIENNFITQYQHRKGILCFEHSLDDIIIDKLIPYLRFNDSNWDDIVLKCNDITDLNDIYDLIHYFTKKLFFMIEETMLDNKLIIIIHHYLRPFCDKKSFLRKLDSIIISYIKKFIRGKKGGLLKFQPNFFNEIFWVGDF